MSVGYRIKTRREQLGLSQQDLAKSLNTTQSQIHKYEKGINSPTSKVIIDIAQTLQVSTDWLLGVSDDIHVENESDLPSDERKILGLYRSLPPNKRESFLRVVSDSVILAQG